ncbi:MAG: serine protease [Alphaproteobacteria bacterium]|nr:MAG: serine protease [Alphaproteobacteria bacterium]
MAATLMILSEVAAGPVVAGAAELSVTIKQVKPAVVGIGTVLSARRPPLRLLGTGFVVVDGTLAITAAHVLPRFLDSARHEYLAVFVPAGRTVHARRARVVATDKVHDVAILAFDGSPLPALRLGNDAQVEEGQEIAFTGFPIGAVLGLFPVTHRGIVSAITPIAIPQVSAQELDARTIRSLRTPSDVFQLDATAYPGNSGSPLYDPATGAVYAIVNSVFVKQTKERVLQDPSGITYAVPIRHARALLATLDTR